MLLNVNLVFNLFRTFVLDFSAKPHWVFYGFQIQSNLTNMAKRKVETSDGAQRKKGKGTPSLTRVNTRSKVGSPLLELGRSRVPFAPIAAEQLANFEGKGAFEMIIDPYIVINNPRVPLPRIPLCRLLAMEAVRPLQEDDVQKMKKEFIESGYVENHAAFYVCMTNKEGATASVEDFRDDWDETWKELNEQFERECDMVEDFRVLKDKMFWVFDGNHRLTAWSQVAKEFPERRAYHPRVRFTLLDPDHGAFVLVEQAMQKLNT